jgi:hypothetical protein
MHPDEYHATVAPPLERKDPQMVPETAVATEPDRIFVLPHRDRSGLRARLTDHVLPQDRPIENELRTVMLEREREGLRGRAQQVRNETAHSYRRISVATSASRSSAVHTLDLTSRALEISRAIGEERPQGDT